MRIRRTARFKKAWNLLTEADKGLGRKAIAKLLTNPHYPSLRVKKMQGVQGIWEARASLSMRLTFEIVGDLIVLHNIGRHDQTLKNP